MKEYWKGGNMLNPVPCVMVSCGDMDISNIVTVAWCGNCSTNPPMLYISVRPERYSYKLIKDSGEFVVNLVNEKLVKACDFAGVKSGREYDKFEHLNLTKLESKYVKCPTIKESPVSLECKVKEVLELGSHHMFIANILGVTVDSELLDENGRFNFEKSKPICYSHGEYYGLGEYLGKFGYSIKKK